MLYFTTDWMNPRDGRTYKSGSKCRWNPDVHLCRRLTREGVLATERPKKTKDKEASNGS